jgi:hypothetical protein
LARREVVDDGGVGSGESRVVGQFLQGVEFVPELELDHLEGPLLVAVADRRIASK